MFSLGRSVSSMIPRYFVSPQKFLSSYEMTRTISKSDVQRFAELSGDTNPIHFEGESPIVHGALLLSIVSGILGTECPGNRVKVISLECKFLTPCPVDTSVRFTVEIISERKITEVNFSCFKDDPVTVPLMQGKAKLLRPAISTDLKLSHQF